jgi:hypothetical protein
MAFLGEREAPLATLLYLGRQNPLRSADLATHFILRLAHDDRFLG